MSGDRFHDLNKRKADFITSAAGWRHQQNPPSPVLAATLGREFDAARMRYRRRRSYPKIARLLRKLHLT
jgi:hypothetical protein